MARDCRWGTTDQRPHRGITPPGGNGDPDGTGGRSSPRRRAVLTFASAILCRLAMLRRAWRVLCGGVGLLAGLAAGACFGVVDILVPKDRRLIVLGSWGGEVAGGNSLAFYRHLADHEGDFRPVFFLRRGPQPAPPGLHCIRGFTPANLWRLLRARSVVCTHWTDFGPLTFSLRTLVVQTWHGVPLKAIGAAQPGLAGWHRWLACRRARRAGLLVAPSRLAAWSLCAAWGVDASRVFLCGQPRNAVLLGGGRGGVSLRELLPDAPPYERVILYCPTWRRPGEERPLLNDAAQAAALGDFLERRRAVLLVRGHLHGAGVASGGWGRRVRELGWNLCPDVNDVLGQVDVLVTDYSSVYVDFLLLDRPIVFLPYDLEAYADRWGWMLDGYDFWTPGAKVADAGGLVEALEMGASAPQRHSADRRRVSGLLNAWESADSCTRLTARLRQAIGLPESSAGDGRAQRGS